MLEITNLTASIGGKTILRDVDLTIPDHEVHVLFGPNGSGKTTLMRAIMGFPEIDIDDGTIVFNGTDITDRTIDERARLGLGISLQRPPTIRGVKTRQLTDLLSDDGEDIEALAEELQMVDFLDRNINEGFSGGEIKRAELLQLFAQRPKFILLDEPESGVDLEAMQVIGTMTNKLLNRDPPCPGPEKKKCLSGLIITHTGGILQHVPADWGHVMCDGRLYCTKRPYKILNIVKEQGYEACITCDLEEE